ncbi:hypothetical protein FQA39_LY19080 [Lamprigera yunnana]|nr:hypothetical protein FQA39_LY19080 [Lamprigera yunnana]
MDCVKVERRKKNPRQTANIIEKITFFVLQPILIGKIVAYFKPEQIEISDTDVWLYAMALASSIFLFIFTIHLYAFGFEEIILKMQALLCNVIYRKCLKLSCTSSSEVTSGHVVTLMTKDVGTFHYGLDLTHQLWIGIVQSFILTYVMYREIGVAAIAGIFLLMLFVPLQGTLAFHGDYNDYKNRNDSNLLPLVNSCKDTERNYNDTTEFEDIVSNVNDELSSLLAKSSNSLKIYKEFKKAGAVDCKVYYTYFTSGGGIAMLLLLTVLFTVGQAMAIWTDYFVNFWATSEEKLSELRRNVTQRM